ncbi:hypothetical protein OMAG_001182 [Candidatus Omnitrophus magneticus]|uniref:Uncharacterized protein n=1 Tax=Candidatus Omnitrophus magneticus TaxID=1609969 RepID=A0A0F0CNV9_9BACT|nr:hypothetical protein OMAG_001182 [Candidatus Omnitrophus magneticus]
MPYVIKKNILNLIKILFNTLFFIYTLNSYTYSEILPTTLQIPSFFNTIKDAEFFENLLLAHLKYATTGIDINNLNYKLMPAFSDDINGVINFQEKKRENNYWAIPCAIHIKTNNCTFEYTATIKENEDISIQSILPKNFLSQNNTVKNKSKNQISEENYYADRPLDGIPKSEIKNILILTEDKILGVKLGETIIELWPLATPLLKKFPDANILIASEFSEIFNGKTFHNKIKILPQETLAELRTSPEKIEKFFNTNNFDLIFYIGMHAGIVKKIVYSKNNTKPKPYLCQIVSPLSITQAFSTAIKETNLMSDNNYNFIAFWDTHGKKYIINTTNIFKNIMKSSKNSNFEFGWAGIWNLTIKMYESLGLKVNRKNLLQLKLSNEETFGAIKWLKNLFDESTKEYKHIKFDPQKKIIVVNVYAVTQKNILTEDEWSGIIAKLAHEIKDAYFIFPRGGKMDPDYEYVERIVRNAKIILKEDVTHKDNLNDIQLVLPRKNIYPYMHDLLGISNAVVSLDTGFSHLASGVYNLPLCLITSPNIIHWIPPKDNIFTIFFQGVFQNASRYLKETEIKKQERINNEIKNLADWLNKQASMKHTLSKRLSSLSDEYASILDKNLLNHYSIDAPLDEKKIHDFAANIVKQLKLPESITPEIKFVNTSEQIGIELSRFSIKLRAFSNKKTYLLIDANNKNQEYLSDILNNESNKIEFIHELLGRSITRITFPEFSDKDLNTKDSIPQNYFKNSIKTRNILEELIARLITIEAILKLSRENINTVSNKEIESLLKIYIPGNTTLTLENIKKILEHNTQNTELSNIFLSDIPLNQQEKILSLLNEKYLPRLNSLFAYWRNEEVAIKEPLTLLPKKEIKNVLLYYDNVAPFKLGEVIMELWPLVAGFLQDFPDSKIYIAAPLAEVFKGQYFGERIKILDHSKTTLLKSSAETVTHFVSDNHINLIISLDTTRNNFIKTLSNYPRLMDKPYLLQIDSITNNLSTFLPTIDKNITKKFSFHDKLNIKYKISGSENLLKTITSPDDYSTPALYTTIINQPQNIFPLAGGWLLSIERCRILGLNISKDNMPEMKISTDESENATKWIWDICQKENHCTMNYNKKIVIINTYAVTQNSFLSEEEWANIIQRIITKTKNIIFVFTHGGKMDEDYYHIERIIKKIKIKLASDTSLNYKHSIKKIILTREDISPKIHNLMGIASACVTIDTGFSHMASGIFNIPTAIFTSKNIEHWLPPRKNIIPLYLLTTNDYLMYDFTWNEKEISARKKKLYNHTQKIIDWINSDKIKTLGEILDNINNNDALRIKNNKHSEILKNFIDSLLSITINKKIILAFGYEDLSSRNTKLSGIIKSFKFLKNHIYYKRFLQNFIVIESSKREIWGKIEPYTKDADSSIFLFSSNTKDINKDGLKSNNIHKIIINDTGFPPDAYYPLFEIILLSIAHKYPDNNIVNMKEIFDKSNILYMEEKNKELIFYLLPNPIILRESDLIKAYAYRKKLITAL